MIVAGLILADRPLSLADEWSATSHGTFFYTDDVAIFSATRRLTLDGDPTQPALDNNLTGQGGDGVFEPMVDVARSFDNDYGRTRLDVRGQGFIYFQQNRFNHGSLQLQALQEFSPDTSVMIRYFIAPDMYLGENEVNHPGWVHSQHTPAPMAAEQVTSQIGSLRFEQALCDEVDIRLLGRFGTRRYGEAFEERNLSLWTLGPHIAWQPFERVKVTLGYHFEEGRAAGHNQPLVADDVSYNNNYASTELAIDLLHNWSLEGAIHYERNQWISPYKKDERYGSIETIWQGEVLLNYRIDHDMKMYTGVQHSRRSENLTSTLIPNTNVAVGIQAYF